MMRAGVFAIVVALAADSAEACHHFSIWRFHRPQSCRMTALAPPIIRARAKIDVVIPAPRPVDEMPLPSLTDIEWGRPPDDDLRGRLLLRFLLQAKETK